MTRAVERIERTFHRFLFESCCPSTCVLVRIAYAVLFIVYVGVWMIDGTRWFSDDGVISTSVVHDLSSLPTWSLFHWLPATPTVVRLGLGILMIHAIGLLLGVASRFQAACIFVWLVSYQCRNPLIGDGEDMVFRMFALFLVFMPTDHALSLGRRLWHGRESEQVATNRSWGLRLMQVQMTMIYVSAAWSKWLGGTWRDGSAMFYVYQMEDLFGRGPVPAMFTESEWWVRAVTWSVLIVEAVLPLALWYPLHAMCCRRRRHLAAPQHGIRDAPVPV